MLYLTQLDLLVLCVVLENIFTKFNFENTEFDTFYFNTQSTMGRKYLNLEEHSVKD